MHCPRCCTQLTTHQSRKYGECVLYEKYVPDIECFNSMPRPKTKLIFPLAFPKPLRPGRKKRSKPSALKAARSTSHPKPLESPTTEPCPPVQIILMEPRPFPSPKSYRSCRRCCRRCWCCKIWSCCRLCMCFRSCRRCRARRGSKSCRCCRPCRGSRSCTCCRCCRRKRDKSVSYAAWPAASELPSPSAATYQRQDFSEEKVIAVTLPERSHSMFAAINNSKPPPKPKFLFQKSPKSSRVVLETPRVHPRRFASVIVPERAKASPRHTAKPSTSPSASQGTPPTTQAIITPQPSPKQTVAVSSAGPFYSKVTPIPEYTGAKEPGNAGKEGSRTETEATPGQKMPTATDAGVPQPPSEGRMSPSPEKCAHKPFMHVSSLPITRNHSPKLIRPRGSYLQEGQARREDARTPPLPGVQWVQKVVLKSKK